MLKRNGFFLKIIIFCFHVFIFSQGVASEDKGDVVGQKVKSVLSNKVMSFNVPAQLLKDGVVEFGLQSNVNIIISNPNFLELRSNRVEGRYRLRRALEILLYGTGLEGSFEDDFNAVVIERLNQKKGEQTVPFSTDLNESVVEDVFVVSSRHWEESFMDVPLSISVVGAEEIEQAGVQNIVQLSPSLVNVSLSVTRGSNTTLTALIRGVGQMDPLAGFEQGVGVYIDDVYLSRPQGAVLDFYDIERIEVLRGPQGTLYGRNTIGGAIKYVTKPLSNRPYLKMKAFSGEYRRRDLIASGGTSSIDERLRVGASVGVFRRDGFGTNYTTGEDNYDKNIKVGRVSAEYTPIDNVFIRISGDATRDDSNARSGVSIYNGEALGSVYDSGAGSSRSGHPASSSEFFSDSSSLSLHWQFSPSLKFETVTAFRRDESHTSIDFDAVASARLDSVILYENEQFTQEMKVKHEGGSFNVVLGAFYLNARYKNALDVEVDEVLGVFDGQVYGAGFFTFGDQNAISRSVFFNVIYDVYDSFEISLGARYTHEKDDAVIVHETYAVPIDQVFISPFFGGEDVILLSDIVYDQSGKEVAPRFHGSRIDRELSPRVSVSWFPEGDTVFFYSVSSGFKGGGFDPRGDYTLESHREGFLPERLVSYELGVKSSILSDFFSFSLVGFINDYRNLQVAESILVDRDQDGEVDGAVGKISNAANVEMRGFELEAAVEISDNLVLNMACGYIRHEYHTSFDSEVAGDLRNLPNTPEKSFSFSFSLTKDVFAGDLSLVGDVSYRGGASIYEYSLNELSNGGYSLFNSSVVWATKTGSWQLGLYGRNLTNKRYRVAGYSLRDLNAESVYYGDPRTLSISVSRSF